MDKDYININETIVSGEINSICESDIGNEYIKFGMSLKKYSKSNEKIYISLNVKNDLYNIYKDLFYKGSIIYIKGYNNSYIDKNKNIKSFITVTAISNNYEEIMNGRSKPYIRYDPDGVMVWNGKRCESELLTDEEVEELEKRLRKEEWNNVEFV